MRKIKLLSLFSGIGAFEAALDRMNIEYELVNFCEIDKYAAKSYCAVHGTDESKNLGDITKVETSLLPNDIDLITYGFPCQDISLAGLQKGFEDNGERTRSGLFFEALRIIEDTKPRVAIAENVRNLVSKKFANEFQIVLDSLEQAGYNNYWQVLNSKNYGIPQNRERVFIVSIRKDLDDGSFKFGEPFPLEFRLKDMLEEEVDDDEYLALMAKYLTFSCPKKIDSITTWTGCEVNNSSFIYNYDVNDRWNFYGEIDEEKLKNKIMTQIDKESFHIRSIVATKRNIICRYRHRQIGKVYDIILTTEELRNNNN